jgi:type II secretory pathway component PulL
MLMDLLLDAFGVDWSRRWVTLRAVLVLVSLLFVPQALLTKGLDWYAHRQAQPLIEQLRHLAPKVPTPDPERLAK